MLASCPIPPHPTLPHPTPPYPVSSYLTPPSPSHSHSHPTPISLPSLSHPSPTTSHSRWVLTAFVACCGCCKGRVACKPKPLAGSHPPPPPPMPPPPCPLLPTGWTWAIDETTGNRYYVHAESGNTQWDRPVGSPSGIAPAKQATAITHSHNAVHSQDSYSFPGIELSILGMYTIWLHAAGTYSQKTHTFLGISSKSREYACFTLHTCLPHSRYCCTILVIHAPPDAFVCILE